jgi:molybdopterin/thiamine biosynthesis adenylyltransferase
MKKSEQRLKSFIEKKIAPAEGSGPLIFNLQRSKDRKALSKLFEKDRINQAVDDYEEQLRELFAVNNPSIFYSPGFGDRFKEHLSFISGKAPLWQQGRWIYFPWFFTLVHLLEEKDFQKVRTARNRNLITEEEQKIFLDATVGIGGLSVGNSVILSIVMQGGANRVRLADHDSLALSNLNRIRAGVESLGLQKTEITARQIYSLNPYARVEIFPRGLMEKNISAFFKGPPKLDVVIDELDNLAVKFLIRMEASRNKVPVVMAADNGDNGVVDIERYDKNPKMKFFHGRMGDVSYEKLASLNKFQIGGLIARHVGPENVPERMQRSLMEMGKTIVSWPQLGGAAILNGSAVAYCVRKILNGQPLEDNRAIISLDEKLVPGYDSASARKKRLKAAAGFKKILGMK